MYKPTHYKVLQEFPNGPALNSMVSVSDIKKKFKCDPKDWPRHFEDVSPRFRVIDQVGNKIIEAQSLSTEATFKIGDRFHVDPSIVNTNKSYVISGFMPINYNDHNLMVLGEGGIRICGIGRAVLGKKTK